MEAVRQVLLLTALCLLVPVTHAADIHDDMIAHGARDGSVPAWVVSTVSPASWVRDCCIHARDIGVQAVIYQAPWSGKPQRVMVLNVWPAQLPSLADDVDADRKRYLQHDPAGKVAGFTLRHPTMPCEASVYEGSDKIDDVLVFCDPGLASGARLSWSMAFDDADPARRAVLDDFMSVVMATRWANDTRVPPADGQ